MGILHFKISSFDIEAFGGPDRFPAADKHLAIQRREAILLDENRCSKLCRRVWALHYIAHEVQKLILALKLRVCLAKDFILTSTFNLLTVGVFFPSREDSV